MNTLDSAADVEARTWQGHTLVPASPPAAAIVAAVAVVEHHSTHQRLDRQGRRFVAAGGSRNACQRIRTAMNRRRNHVAKEEAMVPLQIPKLKQEEVVSPDVPPSFTPYDLSVFYHRVLRGVSRGEWL